MPEHKTKVIWQPGWGEWLPSCSCGWVGSYLRNKNRAIDEAEEHILALLASDDGYA